jgi:hypothetical protein
MVGEALHVPRRTRAARSSVAAARMTLSHRRRSAYELAIDCGGSPVTAGGGPMPLGLFGR